MASPAKKRKVRAQKSESAGSVLDYLNLWRNRALVEPSFRAASVPLAFSPCQQRLPPLPLPLDISKLLLNYIEWKDILSVMPVCRNWLAAAVSLWPMVVVQMRLYARPTVSYLLCASTFSCLRNLEEFHLYIDDHSGEGVDASYLYPFDKLLCQSNRLRRLEIALPIINRQDRPIYFVHPCHTQLQHVVLRWVPYHDGMLQAIAGPNLLILCCEGIDWGAVPPEGFTSLSKCTNLESFIANASRHSESDFDRVMTETRLLFAEAVRQMPNLKELNLKCTDLQSNLLLRALCDSCPHLKRLDITPMHEGAAEEINRGLLEELSQRCNVIC
jgi:hypothetical protein